MFVHLIIYLLTYLYVCLFVAVCDCLHALLSITQWEQEEKEKVLLSFFTNDGFSHVEYFIRFIYFFLCTIGTSLPELRDSAAL